MRVGRVVLALSFLFPPPILSATQEMQLAEPGSPAEVVLRVSYAAVEVTGWDRDWIRMTYEGGEDSRAHLPFVAQGNRVEIIHPGNTALLRVRLEVPRRTDLRLETSNGGPLRIAGIEGVIEAENSNAGVELEGVGGSVVVSTSNGPILAEITRVEPGATTSLVTSNGRIEVVLPHGFAGRVLAESDVGPIESDFHVDAEPAAELRRPGRVLSGRIGSGGGLLRLRTNNAGIRILRGEE